MPQMLHSLNKQPLGPRRGQAEMNYMEHSWYSKKSKKVEYYKSEQDKCKNA